MTDFSIISSELQQSKSELNKLNQQINSKKSELNDISSNNEVVNE